MEKWDAKRTHAAEFFKCSLPTIDAWIRNGCPVKERNARGGVGMLNLSDMTRWKIAQSQNRTQDPIAERARRDSEAADKLALENARTRGEIVAADTVTSSWVGIMSEVRARLLSLPTSLAPQVIGATTEEARALIEAALYDALLSLADGTPGSSGSPETAAEADSEPMGGPAPEAVEGVQRRAGAVAD